MAQEFRLPDLGEGLREAEVVRWFVVEGTTVEEGDPLVEVETAKAAVEITSPFSGTVLHRGAPEGATVAVGDLLLVIGEPGETWGGGGDEPAGTAPSPAESGPTAPPRPPAEAAAPAPDAGAPQQVRAMPLVRRLARQHGIDLARVAGTGPAGAITRADIEAAIAAGEGPDEEQVRMSPTRRAIAEHMERSWREIPHVTVEVPLEASALLAAHRRLRTEVGRAVPLEALVARAVIPALRAHPEFNAAVEGDVVVYRRRYHLGFAVDTPVGLVVVVVRDADRLGTVELADRIGALAAAARDRRISPDDLRGQTFTISNIGAIGGGSGTPIIPYGTTAILSVGRAVDAPVARHGGIFVAPVAPLDLSYDHRVIDGALGQRFLETLMAGLGAIDELL